MRNLDFDNNNNNNNIDVDDNNNIDHYNDMLMTMIIIHFVMSEEEC